MFHSVKECELLIKLSSTCLFQEKKARINKNANSQIMKKFLLQTFCSTFSGCENTGPNRPGLESSLNIVFVAYSLLVDNIMICLILTLIHVVG